MATGKTLIKWNACSDVRRSVVENKIAGLNGLRSEGVKRSWGWENFAPLPYPKPQQANAAQGHDPALAL